MNTNTNPMGSIIRWRVQDGSCTWEDRVEAMVDIGGNEEGGEEEAQREQTLDCEEGRKEVVKGHGISEIGGLDLL